MSAVSGRTGPDAKRVEHQDRVTGWWVFAGIVLGLSGTLDFIWGIAAIANASFFINGQHYIASDNLHVWGWVTLILGIVKVIAAGSLFAGGGFGRWMGVLAACISAIVALITLPAYPFWGICSFALAIIVVYQLARPTPA